ncbi:hypothetical protein D3P96_06520 [Weissella viridescens]|uniref:Uncharacterized protein n=1 Tax=Weissella viridescens TaxID=1629 RepID=A0A3P2RIQ2_WEIVI|nr:hypothetical protein [Weissella viridescens]RRG17602.1 hypothetical protein D3P96_06520 [Weissella viridescens]
MLKRIETDQHGQYVRLPKSLVTEPGELLEVSQRPSGTIVLQPVDETAVAQAVRLAELFENWEGIYQPSEDEWQENEEED